MAVAAAVAVILGCTVAVVAVGLVCEEQSSDLGEAVAVCGEAVQTDGLVGGGEDAEEGEDDACVPGCADGPG